ncbi:uncharacterized protein LOC18778889 isoform X2 [Prunus persica]|uniref:uncharacterized protein LOC18778889 isoform X2 n=1 Tax=Prunus persica TaxID=3760 RepID=UPI0009AB646F|nr:uncharacterized protein LOC18778889 isoform X2 [Prunus persica]
MIGAFKGSDTLVNSRWCFLYISQQIPFVLPSFPFSSNIKILCYKCTLFPTHTQTHTSKVPANMHAIETSMHHDKRGFVLGKKSLGKRKANASEGNSNCWEMNVKYKSITYWNHDSLPSQDDAFLRCFHWLAVAKSMHEPATAEDLVSASAALEKMK